MWSLWGVRILLGCIYLGTSIDGTWCGSHLWHPCLYHNVVPMWGWRGATCRQEHIGDTHSSHCLWRLINKFVWIQTKQPHFLSLIIFEFLNIFSSSPFMSLSFWHNHVSQGQNDKFDMTMACCVIMCVTYEYKQI
jgi:hypothetical protein